MRNIHGEICGYQPRKTMTLTNNIWDLDPLERKRMTIYQREWGYDKQSWGCNEVIDVIADHLKGCHS